MRAISRRLDNIERVTSANRSGPTVVLQWFGSPVTGAVACGASWGSGAGEALEEFEARVFREAPWPEGGGFRLIKFTGERGGFSDADVL